MLPHSGKRGNAILTEINENVHTIGVHGLVHEDIVVVVVGKDLLDGSGGAGLEFLDLLVGGTFFLEFIVYGFDVGCKKKSANKDLEEVRKGLGGLHFKCDLKASLEGFMPSSVLSQTRRNWSSMSWTMTWAPSPPSSSSPPSAEGLAPSSSKFSDPLRYLRQSAVQRTGPSSMILKVSEMISSPVMIS